MLIKMLKPEGSIINTSDWLQNQVLFVIGQKVVSEHLGYPINALHYLFYVPFCKLELGLPSPAGVVLSIAAYC